MDTSSETVVHSYHQGAITWTLQRALRLGVGIRLEKWRNRLMW